jgi:integrase/recombinase XerD
MVSTNLFVNCGGLSILTLRIRCNLISPHNILSELYYLLESIIICIFIYHFVSRLSDKQITETLGSNTTNKEKQDLDLERKIALATQGFTTAKFCEFVLRDRNRLSKENALIISEYIVAMKREINPRLNTIRTTIQFLSELSRSVGIAKNLSNMTQEDVLLYLDSCRKSENEDPLHKWIGTYNSRRIVLFRFFKWLYYPNLANSDKRSDLSISEGKPECIMDIPQLKRKEISCYKPSDLWSQEDDLLFLKWVTNKRDRCYHTVARDLSARPHEILGIRIKDIAFKTVDNKQYAEVLVSGKTGSRHIPLIQSIPYIKDWLSNHPSRNNLNSPLFVGLGKKSMGRKQLTPNGLYQIYKYYKEEFFPKLLAEDSTILNEQKEMIRSLLQKPFNPYIRRHSALTEKSTKLKSNTLNQHAGWSMNSNMAQKYIHYFGNESSESLLEAYGIVTKDNIPIDRLNPKICPNCNEGNTQDSKFCAKCRMVLTYDAYSETVESEKQNGDRVTILEKQMQSLVSTLSKLTEQGQVNTLAQSLYNSEILKEGKEATIQ